MRKILILLAGMALGYGLWAQGGPGGPLPQGQPGQQGQPPRMAYDASKEVTLTGSVTAVNVATQGPGPFVTLAISAGDATYEVMAGPQFMLTQQGVSFSQGDSLTIVGVVMQSPQGGASQATRLLARQITKGSTVVTLLDSNGRPTGMGRPS